MAAGSTRQRSKSDCLPGNVWVREESQTLRPSARKVAFGPTESIAPAPKSSGSSTAEPPAGSSVITGTFLNGQRTSNLHGAGSATAAGRDRNQMSLVGSTQSEGLF